MSEEWLYVDLGTGRSAFESRSPRVSGVEEVEAMCCVKVDIISFSHIIALTHVFTVRQHLLFGEHCCGQF